MMATNEIVCTSHTPECHNGWCLRFVRDLPMTIVFVLFSHTHTHTRDCFSLCCHLSLSPYLSAVCLCFRRMSVCLSVFLSLSLSLSLFQLHRVRQRDCRPTESFNLIRYLTDNNRALFKRNKLKKLAPLLYAPTPTYIWGVENF